MVGEGGNEGEGEIRIADDRIYFISTDLEAASSVSRKKPNMVTATETATPWQDFPLRETLIQASTRY